MRSSDLKLIIVIILIMFVFLDEVLTSAYHRSTTVGLWFSVISFIFFCSSAATLMVLEF